MLLNDFILKNLWLKNIRIARNIREKKPFAEQQPKNHFWPFLNQTNCGHQYAFWHVVTAAGWLSQRMTVSTSAAETHKHLTASLQSAGALDLNKSYFTSLEPQFISTITFKNCLTRSSYNQGGKLTPATSRMQVNWSCGRRGCLSF